MKTLLRCFARLASSRGRLGLTLCLLFLSTCSLLAQTLGGIEGIVKDGTGALVAGATVTVTNTSTNAVRNGSTDSAGLYNFAALPPGPYSVRVEMAGFKASVRNLTIEVQQTAQADFAMALGASDQTIEVTASSAQLNSTDATVGAVIGEKQILELPLNGRDFLQLVALSSNVTTNFPSPGQAQLRQGGSRAAENYSVSGQRGTSNYYTLDGVSNTDVNFNLIIMQPSVDALQEFKVQTGVYPAQFGREATQINVSTKSGTNHFHGTVFEFLRNDVLDAKSYDFTQTHPAKNPFKWNQFGFTLGGPVWIPKVFDGRDKLFFLSNYEAFRLRQSANTVYTVPTLAMRNGDFSNLLAVGNQLYDPSTKTNVGGVITGTPFAGNLIPASKVNPTSTKLLAYIPLPNIGSATTSANNFQTAVASPLNKSQFTQRMDYNQSSKMTWFARYTFASEDSVTGGEYKSGGKVTTNAKQAVLGNTRIFTPNMVNDVRFAWNNFKNAASTELAGVTDVVDSLGITGLSTPNPLTWGIPYLQGFTDGISNIGNVTSAPFVLDDSTFQVLDNFTWTIGKHSLQLGADIRRDHYDYYGNEFGRGGFNWNGSMTRNPNVTTGGESFADFLTGYCSQCAAALALAQAQNRATSQNYYVDDTWRVTSKLSINAGLRYEFIPPWYDKSQNSINTIVPGSIPNVAGVTDPTLQPTLYRAGTGDFYAGHQNIRFAAPIQTSRQDLYGGRMVTTDKVNFAPRLGIVYSPSEKWSIRTGFGIFYTQDSSIESFDLARGFGRISVSQDANNPKTTFQNFIPTGSSFVTLSGPNTFGIVPNIRTPYVMQYLLNVQHSIAKNTMVEIGYAGSKGQRLWGLQNLNPAIPGTTGSTASRSPYNYLGIIQVLQSGNYSNYNSLTAKITRTFSAGLTYTAGYTFSKSLDNSSAIRGTAQDILPQNSRCLPCDYGHSAFDIPNRFVSSAQYELPFGNGKRFLNKGGILNELVGGWQLGSIVSWQSGIAVNTISGVDTPGTGGFLEIRLNATGVSPNLPSEKRTLSRWWNPAAFNLPAAGTFGTASRNSLRAPSFFDWDASAIKNFHIHKEQALQFRFETFNTANHANWGQPIANWGSTSITTPGASFGSITTTANPMRQMQAALKFVF